MKRRFPNAYAEETSLEVENEIAKGVFVSVGYQFVHALKLPLYEQHQRSPQRHASDRSASFHAADPNFGFALEATPTAYSIYHAGSLSVRKPFAHHYSVLANYTYSKSIDLATDIQLTDSPMDYLDPNLDRGLGENDMRHHFVLALLGESPNTWRLALRNFKLSVLNTFKALVTTRSLPALT